MAISAVAAIVLIFVFIGREARPHVLGGGVRARGEPRKTWCLARQWNGYDEPVYIWQPVGDVPKLNVLPLFVGALKVTLLAMLISVPARHRRGDLRRALRPARCARWSSPVELLAGIPSVVLGFFALMLVATCHARSLRLPLSA
jgi:phosphate transport system permease protein